MNVSIAFEPLLPWPFVWSMFGIALLFSTLILVMRIRGAWLRSIALLALIMALANPIITQEDRTPVPATVAIIVDQSQSQRLDQRTDTTERTIEQLKTSFERFDQFDLRIIRTTQNDNIDSQTQTRLFTTLRTAFRDIPTARIGGAVFITDGQVHDIPNTMESIGFNAPLHALVTGREDEYDRKIQIDEAPRFSIVGKPVSISYRVENQGNMPDSTTDVEVSIYRNGTLLAVEQAIAGEVFETEVELDRAGKNIIELSTDPVGGELTTSNNKAVTKVEGIRENLRVLLVSGEPHSGERTWRNLLKSDASVDLVHFTILRPPEKQDGTPINELSLIAFPTRELFVEKIDDFDLIVFDRYKNRNVLPVLYYDYIAEYVRNGGALLIAAGEEYASNASIARTPLVNALPALPTGDIQMAGFYPRLTAEGKRHPVTRNLPGSDNEPPTWGRWFRTINVENNEGTTIMQAANQNPLLVLDAYGQGRVGLMLSDHGWLWARGFEGGGPHINLYRRLAHWLMKEPDLEAEALTAEPEGQGLKITRQTMQDKADPVNVITPDGSEFSVVLEKSDEGLFEAILKTEQIGLFEVSDSKISTLAHIGPVNAPEFNDMISTRMILAPHLKKTGGDVRRILASNRDLNIPNVLPIRNNRKAYGSGWIGFKMTSDTKLLGINSKSLLSGFLGLAILLLVITSMWYREGK